MKLLEKKIHTLPNSVMEWKSFLGEIEAQKSDVEKMEELIQQTLRLQARSINLNSDR